MIQIRDFFKLNIKFDIIYLVVGNYKSTHFEFLKQISEIEYIVSNSAFNRIVFVSSVAVYGEQINEISINSSFNRPALYGMAKLAQEFFISSCSSYSILRFTYLYGPGMGESSIIPIWINSAIHKKTITIYGDGLRTQDYLHVSDAVELCLKAGKSNQNSCLIGATGHSVSNLDLAGLISELIPDCEIVYVPGESGASFRYDVDFTIRALNWQPKIDIEFGIRDLILR